MCGIPGPGLGGQILNHCTSREVLEPLSYQFPPSHSRNSHVKLLRFSNVISFLSLQGLYVSSSWHTHFFLYLANSYLNFRQHIFLLSGSLSVSIRGVAPMYPLNVQLLFQPSDNTIAPHSVRESITGLGSIFLAHYRLAQDLTCAGCSIKIWNG